MDEQPTPKSPKQRPAFFTRRDGWIFGLCLLAAAAALVLWLVRRPGGVATVTVGLGSQTSTQQVPLGQNQLLKIDAALPVQLEVLDGRIRFVHSVCPDHTCEGFGWLSQEGDWALCVPAQVTVRVTESS